MLDLKHGNHQHPNIGNDINNGAGPGHGVNVEVPVLVGAIPLGPAVRDRPAQEDGQEDEDDAPEWRNANGDPEHCLGAPAREDLQ